MELLDIFADCCKNDCARVTFRLKRTREHIIVSLFCSDPIPSIDEQPESLPLVDRVIRLLGESINAGTDEEHRALEDGALGPILQAAESIIPEPKVSRNSPGADTAPDQRPSLRTILFPKESHYRLDSTTLFAGPVLVPIQPREACRNLFDDEKVLLEDQANFPLNTSLPRYSMDQVEIVKQLKQVSFGIVCLATVNGQSQQQFLCKATSYGLDDHNLDRELRSLQKILHATASSGGGSPACRVPVLRGYVEHPGSGLIVGFLRDWVPSRLSLEDVQKTTFQTMGVTREMRERWAGQIKRTAKSLRAVGVVWGEARPSNIVIDFDGDAWVVDLCCGWPDGWFDDSLQEIIERDEHGVARILELLDVDTCV